LSLPYEKELEIKERQVRSLLESACGGDISSWFMPVHESPVTTGYRNKMEFTFGDSYKGGPLTLGMHRRGSFYDLADASMCELVDEDYRRIVRCVRNYFAAKGIPFLHRQSHEGYLRHLIVRKASHTREILVDLVTTTDTKCLSANGYSGTEKELLEGMRDALVSLPLQGRFAGILHTKNDSVADIVEDQGTEILYGQASFEEQILGLRFLVTPFSFFQTNSYGAEVLYSIARDYIRRIAPECSENRADKKPVVFDLYCGTGTISQLVSPSAAKVIGVEIVEEAVTAARENAKKNGITNCTFIAGDVLRVIDEIEEKPDLIILDPPRDGVHPKAMPKLIAYGVPYILYISCKATSLARDLPVLREGGYVPVAGTCVDQFPRTANIETVCLLTRENSCKTCTY
jgi:23S rRNA (uracil-5-)-methyltransferase RumA